MRKNELGQRIKLYRKQNKITQSSLASGICSVSYLSKLENNAIIPSDDIKELLCDRLGISIEDLDLQNELSYYFCKDFIKFHMLCKQKKLELLVIKEEYTSIFKKYSGLNNPESLLMKELMYLRLSLLEANQSKAEISYKEVTKLVSYKSSFLDNYYYRYCGLYHYIYGDLEKAFNYYKIAKDCNTSGEIEDIYYQLALVSTKLKRNSLSTIYLLKALDGFQKKMNYNLCVNCNLLLGVNYRKMKEYKKAIRIYENILNEVQFSLESRMYAKVYHNLGIVYSELGDSHKAINYFQKSIEYKDGDKEKVNTYYILAKEYIRQKKRVDASQIIKMGLKLSEKYEVQDYIIKFYVINYSLIESEHLNNYLENYAIPFFIKKKEWNTVKEFMLLSTKFYEKKNKYKKAYFLLKNIMEGDYIND